MIAISGTKHDANQQVSRTTLETTATTEARVLFSVASTTSIELSAAVDAFADVAGDRVRTAGGRVRARAVRAKNQWQRQKLPLDRGKPPHATDRGAGRRR